MRPKQLKTRHLVISAVLGLGALLVMPQVSSAMVQGQCSVCHTMHNSQNGSAMNFSGSDTPNNTLLRGDCMSCHTGTNDGSNVRPYVLGDVLPTYNDTGVGNTLAGGNFWWVDQGADATGHNVDMLPAGNVDGDLTTPPGFDEAAGWAARTANQADMVAGGIMTCAGTAGCHGNRANVAGSTNSGTLAGAHHADDTTIDGLTVGTSFRFLSGVLGAEQNDITGGHAWEYGQWGTTVASNHNGYAGAARGADSTDTSSTISSLCGQCHGAFHNSAGSAVVATAGIQGTAWGSPWVRHPTDLNMVGLTGADYVGALTGSYNVNVPVGRTTGSSASKTTTSFNDGNGAIVLCISCHRAHGSPYDDLLRWNYSLMTAGNSGTGSATGCFVCHTTKDGV